MVRHLPTLILSGVLGSIFMAGNAEACHRTRCGCAPAPCAVTYCPPAPCVTTCAPRVKHCFTMPKLFCHKKAYCPPPVCYYVAAAPVSAPMTSPQTSAQH
jgi:hypothetical protein